MIVLPFCGMGDGTAHRYDLMLKKSQKGIVMKRLSTASINANSSRFGDMSTVSD